MTLVKRKPGQRSHSIVICEFSTDEDVVVRTGKVFGTVDGQNAGAKIVSVFASSFVAPTGDKITGRILKNGSAIAGSNFSIDDGVLFSPEVAISEQLALGDNLSVQILQVGSTTPGKGLAVSLRIA